MTNRLHTSRGSVFRNLIRPGMLFEFATPRQFKRSTLPSTMRRFDSKALYQALDEQRRSRELSWREVSAGDRCQRLNNLADTKWRSAGC
jgi:hypothetical protein